MTTRLYEPSWRIRALIRAQSLVGEGWTANEQKAIDAYEQVDPGYGVFLAFGICPEKQVYINGTIAQLKNEDITPGQLLTAWVRLCWSCEELIR